MKKDGQNNIIIVAIVGIVAIVALMIYAQGGVNTGQAVGSQMSSYGGSLGDSSLKSCTTDAQCGYDIDGKKKMCIRGHCW